MGRFIRELGYIRRVPAALKGNFTVLVILSCFSFAYIPHSNIFFYLDFTSFSACYRVKLNFLSLPSLLMWFPKGNLWKVKYR